MKSSYLTLFFIFALFSTTVLFASEEGNITNQPDVMPTSIFQKQYEKFKHQLKKLQKCIRSCTRLQKAALTSGILTTAYALVLSVAVANEYYQLRVRFEEVRQIAKNKNKVKWSNDAINKVFENIKRENPYINGQLKALKKFKENL